MKNKRRRINGIIHIYSICIYFIFTFISYSACIEKQNLYEKMKLVFDSEIFLIIEGNGTQQILNNNNNKTDLFNFEVWDYQDYYFAYSPSEILVNGKKTDIVDFYVYNLTLEENNITIRFNETITDCNVMFANLDNIKYVNFNNFDFSKVTSVKGILKECSNLISVDLSTFNKAITDTSYMFSGCSNLVSLDLSSMDTSSVTCFHDMFLGCEKLISLDLSNFDTSSAILMGGMFGYCHNLVSLNLSSFNTSKVTYMSHMFLECTSLIYLDLNNFNTKSIQSITNMFQDCNPNLIYCIKEANSNNERLRNEIEIESDNKVNNCSDICFYENKKIIFDNKTCALNCTDINKYDYNNICFSTCPDGIYNLGDKICIENEQKNSESIDSNDKDNIINNIINELIAGILDPLILKDIENEQKDIIFTEKNITYQITTPYNQENNEYNNNISTINLGLCEDRLKLYYNISNNKKLLILKTDIYEENSLKPKIEYEVYNSETKEKLDLNICKNITINVSIPINNPIMLEENNYYKNYFKLNLSHEYYKDICFPYTTEANTDITIKDRIDEYHKYYEFCPNNCIFKEYNNKKKQAICECNVDINDIIHDFKDIKNIININIMKCYYTLFKKEGIIKNIGNYTIDVILIIIIILSILFKIKGYNKLIMKINMIFENIKDLKEKKKEKVINNVNNPLKKKKIQK